MNKFKPLQEAEKIEKDYKKTIPAKAQKKREQGFSPMFSNVFLFAISINLYIRKKKILNL